MADDSKQAGTARRERQSRALRENLKRRKAQARERVSTTREPPQKPGQARK